MASSALSDVWFDCPHCRRRSIGVVQFKAGLRSDNARVRCTHIDCEQTSPWAIRVPMHWNQRGGLTQAQLEKRTLVNS